MLRAARTLGHDVSVVAIEDEAGPEIDGLAAELGGCQVHWMSLGQLERCIRTFRAAGVSEAVMAGKVEHARVFSNLQPDPMLQALLARLDAKTAEPLLAAVARALGEHGIRLLDSTALLSSFLARAGQLSARRPGDAMRRDFELGARIADGIAALDVGQAVVVKDGTVVAVEAMEGTDATILRAGQVAGPGTRVIKVARPSQDMRFDVPVVGLSTIQAMRSARADGLSIDAGRTLILDGPAFTAAADAAGIVVVARERS